MTAESEGDFWSWSLARYAQDGVEAAALKLQDEFNLNVNIVLWACWCAESYEPLPELVIRKAEDLIGHWSRDVTTPLRTARRALKIPPIQADRQMTDGLRAAVKDAELSSERVEQSMLEHLAMENLAEATATDPQGAARRNLAAYASLAGAPKKPGFSVYLLESLIDLILPAEQDRNTGSSNAT